ncbi:MAG: methyl-accepting chemotaxis protein [Actinomycetota bacterium]|jgi:methyl-accepting chemotaxis protein|nr:methyl-accepting chemotaxis protein [Actinomycetota bacterium]
MPSMRMPALLAGATVLALAAGLTMQSVRTAGEVRAQFDAQLAVGAQHAETLLSGSLERARALTLQVARDPSPEAMAYVPTVFPNASGLVCRTDAAGVALACARDGKVLNPQDRPRDLASFSFFASASSLAPGQVFESKPYLSPTAGEWVVTDATPLELDGKPDGVVFVEVLLESVRLDALRAQGNSIVRIVASDTGQVVLDGRFPPSSAATNTAKDTTFVGRLGPLQDQGVLNVPDGRASFVKLHRSRRLPGVDENSWLVFASAPEPPSALSKSLPPTTLGLFGLAFALLGGAGWLHYRQTVQRRADAERTLVERDTMARQLNEMSDALSRASTGDLGVRLPVQDLHDQTMARLAGSFDDTLSQLRLLVGSAQATGVQLSRSAAELQALSRQQASSASEQSAAVTQTTVTVEELAATAAQIADTADAVARAATETMQLAAGGRAAVVTSVQAMDRISDRVVSIAESSAGLGERIQEVGNILELIDDLSDQTNLLALNAAIEAARAGEHGRGFAVVAAQVRTLAERAQDSTSRIQAIVGEIRTHAKATIAASEEGAREVQAGGRAVRDVAAALDMIEDKVDETTAAAREISIATQQQRSASDQVVVAMTQVSETARQVAVGSKQGAGAAAGLASLAGEMQESIASFSVKERP